MRIPMPMTFLLGAAVGYVAGSAAGRERYEQIKSTASTIMQDPRVQSAADKATESGKHLAEAAGSAAADKAKDISSKVGDLASRKGGTNGVAEHLDDAADEIDLAASKVAHQN